MSGLIRDVAKEQIRVRSHPGLGRYGILSGSEKGFNVKVLLDRLEEQLDLSTRLVNLRNRDSRKLEMVGQEYEGLFGFLIVEFGKPEFLGIKLSGPDCD